MIQSFPNLYGYLCDCIKFVDCTEIQADENESYMITRGVEPENQDENGNITISKPNHCHLRKLSLDTENVDEPFTLTEVQTFEDEG